MGKWDGSVWRRGGAGGGLIAPEIGLSVSKEEGKRNRKEGRRLFMRVCCDRTTGTVSN